MFKKLDFNLNEIYELAYLLKKHFPEAKIKIKLKNEVIEVHFLNPVDLYKLEEIKLDFQRKFSNFKILYFHQKI
jgi:hypothetical protein